MQIVEVANIIINLIKPSMQRPEWFARKTSLLAHFQIKFENFAFRLFFSSPQKFFNFRGQLCTLNHAICFKVANIIINLIKPSMQRPEWFARKTSLFAHFQIKFENFAFRLFFSSPQKFFNFRGPQFCTLNHENCFKVANIIIS